MKVKMKAITLWSCPVLLFCFGAAAMNLHERPALPVPKWQKRPHNPAGVQWWRTTLSGTEPEVAILRLTPSEYKAFLNSPMDYLNNNGILSKNTTNVVQCIDKVPQATSTGAWTVVVSHTPNSTSIWTVAQQ